MTALAFPALLDSTDVKPRLSSRVPDAPQDESMTAKPLPPSPRFQAATRWIFPCAAGENSLFFGHGNLAENHNYFSSLNAMKIDKNARKKINFPVIGPITGKFGASPPGLDAA